MYKNIMQQFASSCSVCKQLTEKICSMLAVWTLSDLVLQLQRIVLIVSSEQVYQRLIQNPVKY